MQDDSVVQAPLSPRNRFHLSRNREYRSAPVQLRAAPGPITSEHENRPSSFGESTDQAGALGVVTDQSFKGLTSTPPPAVASFQAKRTAGIGSNHVPCAFLFFFLSWSTDSGSQYGGLSLTVTL